MRSPAIPTRECSGASVRACRIQVCSRNCCGRWDGEETVIRFDEPSGAWIFVCVHSTVLGPAGGGTRMRVYEQPADGLADAMRLSQAMTVKMALANAERGGGKAVLAVPALPTGDARRTLLLRYGELVSSLGGTYTTAGDMNISPADLDVVRERCPWVYGTTGAGGNSGRGTAIGVLQRDSRECRAGVRLDRSRQSNGARAGRRLGRSRSRALPRRGGRGGARVGRRRGARRRDRRHRRVAERRAHDRMRRLRTVCRRRHAERGLDPAPAVPHRRGLGEQPARRAGGRAAICTTAGSSTRPTT